MTEATYSSLVGRSVIVTGGGRGLGREMALALIEAGANVMATAAASADELRALKQEADSSAKHTEQFGTLQTTIADAASFADCERVVSETINAFGSVHSLSLIHI